MTIPEAPTREARFEAVARTHAPAVGSYLRRRIYPLPASDVDDLLAETLVVTWRRFDDLPESAELAWMLGVARRVLANAKRTSQRREARQFGAVHLTNPSAESLVIADLSLATALDALSTDERDILLASIWDGLSVGDLAVLYDVTTNAAALRLSRAKAHFLEAFHAA